MSAHAEASSRGHGRLPGCRGGTPGCARRGPSLGWSKEPDAVLRRGRGPFRPTGALVFEEAAERLLERRKVGGAHVEVPLVGCADRLVDQLRHGVRLRDHGAQLVQVIERHVQQLLRIAAGNQLVFEAHRHQVEELMTAAEEQGAGGGVSRGRGGGRWLQPGFGGGGLERDRLAVGLWRLPCPCSTR